MEKRGASHIEFILAFVLFASFVAFAIYLFNPAKTTGLTDSSLPYAIDEIVKNTSVDVISYSVKVIVPQSRPSISIEIDTAPQDANLRVENYRGGVLPSERAENTVFFDHRDNDFVIIEFSKDFEPSERPKERPLVNKSLYEIASSSESEMISERRVILLNDSYSRDYTGLKNQLKIPSGVNFAASLDFPNGDSITMQRDVPAGLEVFSDSSRREVLRADGSSAFADFMVKVW